MRWKKKLLQEARLYLILDRQVNTDDQLFKIAVQAIGAGVDLIQLRDKVGNARDLLGCFQHIASIVRHRVPLIMNDRVDLALAAKAEGVHLGQEDMPIREARRIIGAKALIGISCQTLEQAREAQDVGADYIGFGSVFKTPTKPERFPLDLNFLEKVVHKVSIPIFAIGGIGLKQIATLRAIGVERFAVCRAICQASHVKEAARNIVREIRGSDR